MPEYDLDFAHKLAKVANQVEEDDPWAYDARRVTVYLSRLSAEISLKALLERAGVSIEEIKKRSHDLRGLLKDVSKCEVLAEVTAGSKSWVPAARLRAVTLGRDSFDVPIGVLVDGEDQGTSQYPNQIRYGGNVVDFDPSLLAEMAILLAEWAKRNFEQIRLPEKK